MRRAASVLAGAAVLALAVAAGMHLLRPPAPVPESPVAERQPTLRLISADWADLPGWATDDPSPALAAFERSCRLFAKRDPADQLAREPVYGRIGDWQAVCGDLAGLQREPAALRALLESRLSPWLVTDDGAAEGLLTGYYEPLLAGARQPGEHYQYPLHKRPPDLVNVDLGQFDKTLDGRRIAGKVSDGRLVPYASRAEIDGGALQNRGLELLWVRDAVDKFFLQIQGSGQVNLPDGSAVRVGYADQNGHAYRAIGRDLIEMGELTRDKVSMQTIKAWLRAHPDRADTVMAKNPSYVFFRELNLPGDAQGPPGAQGVPLTPERSLAVDRRFVPLGALVWIDTTAPHPDGDKPLRRLMVAQDTGGAIKGVVRGDVFWGAGAQAEHLAGHMKSPARFWVLLPRNVVPVG